MSWIEFHPTKIQRLQKFSDLMDVTKWGVNEALGFLGNLWGQVIEIREDGDLTGWRPSYIAHLTSANGDPKAIFDALLATNWLKKCNGKILVHDWIDFGGRHLRGKYGSGKNQENIKELKRIWKLHGLVYGESARRAKGEQKVSDKASHLTLPNLTSPDRTVPDLTNLTSPKQRRANGKSPQSGESKKSTELSRLKGRRDVRSSDPEKVRMPFGDHKDVFIINLEPDYCKWLLTEFKGHSNLTPNLRAALEHRVKMKEDEGIPRQK